MKPQHTGKELTTLIHQMLRPWTHTPRVWKNSEDFILIVVILIFSENRSKKHSRYGRMRQRKLATISLCSAARREQSVHGAAFWHTSTLPAEIFRVRLNHLMG